MQKSIDDNKAMSFGRFRYLKMMLLCDVLSESPINSNVVIIGLGC